MIIDVPSSNAFSLLWVLLPSKTMTNNLFQFKDFQVLLDYARNSDVIPDALELVQKLKEEEANLLYGFSTKDIPNK